MGHSPFRPSHGTVYELMAEGSVKYVKLGRTRRIRRADIEAYVESLATLPN
ncbi:helix-turn-helix domain-containing protein [Streptomyces sp. NPDC058686]|uniref:helix-turn-helix domain-containing protein n=1 Tax=Streptomyces sp. NPDC058686 TaxID=3346599 RepID=UPI003653E503